ncbi:esterase FE4-like [Neocloeon triangulifer]|uniref:esterase FE4-like n=1 Tax=Neocloeon triangulifer TaxID=2078957 RepID=UPI00286EC067|nr:esterase FE4-like [Neocloeon triangulifer]
MGRAAFFCLVLLSGLLVLVSAGEKPTVTIRQGKLKGKVLKTRTGKDVFTFLGIPYAKPPVKDLRFKAPVAAGAWEGVYDASKNRSKCAQLRYPEMRYVGDENCLFINVYTTKLPSEGSKVSAPVIFYIHGGLFVQSSGDLDKYDPELILDGEPGNIIFVTFNYRLGPLGFLSTESADCPGNFGLKDQVMALKWVRDNIAAFGGNPDKVALMGDNAGAVSAHLHMMSPMSKGLFHVAISQSGNALTHWAWNRDPLGRTHRLAELLECGDNTTSNHDILKCMRAKPAELIVKKSNVVLQWRTDWIVTFIPTIEYFDMPEGTAFLTEEPRELMQKNEFYPVPWLTSVTSHDGLPHSLNLLLFGGIMSDLNNEFEKYFPYYFELDGEMDRAVEASKLIRDFYMKGASFGMGSQLQLANLHTDYYYFMPLVKSVAMHIMAESPPVYVYHFSFQNRNNRIAIGVPQGDDTQYMIPKDDGGRFAPKDGSKEMEVAQNLISMIKNFINYGQPIPKGNDAFGVEWPPADMQKLYYLDINKKMTLNDTFYSERIGFWNGIEDLLNTGHSVLTDGPEDPNAKDEL